MPVAGNLSGWLMTIARRWIVDKYEARPRRPWASSAVCTAGLWSDRVQAT